MEKLSFELKSITLNQKKNEKEKKKRFEYVPVFDETIKKAPKITHANVTMALTFRYIVAADLSAH